MIEFNVIAGIASILGLVLTIYLIKLQKSIKEELLDRVTLKKCTSDLVKLKNEWLIRGITLRDTNHLTFILKKIKNISRDKISEIEECEALIPHLHNFLAIQANVDIIIEKLEISMGKI